MPNTALASLPGTAAGGAAGATGWHQRACAEPRTQDRRACTDEQPIASPCPSRAAASRCRASTHLQRTASRRAKNELAIARRPSCWRCRQPPTFQDLPTPPVAPAASRGRTWSDARRRPLACGASLQIWSASQVMADHRGLAGKNWPTLGGTCPRVLRVPCSAARVEPQHQVASWEGGTQQQPQQGAPIVTA